MNTTGNATVNTNTESKNTQKVDFGNGRYSPLMEECYRDAQNVFNLSPEKSEKLARKIASDFGELMASGKIGLKSVKIGKVNDDGKVTLSEAGTKVKGVTLTLPLFALKAMKYAAEAGDNGFLWGSTEWQPCQKLVEYFDTL